MGITLLSRPHPDCACCSGADLCLSYGWTGMGLILCFQACTAGSGRLSLQRWADIRRKGYNALAQREARHKQIDDAGAHWQTDVPPDSRIASAKRTRQYLRRHWRVRVRASVTCKVTMSIRRH